MGFLDFLKYKKKTHEENIKGIDFNPPIINEVNPFNPIGHDEGIDPLPREYSNKGVSLNKANKKNPYSAYLSFGRKVNKSGEKTSTLKVHIGSYPTKEEAQKARWEFIENLK